MQVSIQQFRKLMMVIIVLVLTGVLAGAIPFFLQRMDKRTTMSVTVVPVSTINKPLCIERPGSAVHATMVPVYSEGAGRVSDVYVTAGQAVKVGQPLVKLEITVGVDAGEAMEAPSPASVKVPSPSKDIYEKALNEYNRYQKLYEQGAIARKQLEAAQARLQAVQPDMMLQQSQQNVATTVKTGTVVKGPVTIKAPIDGMITGNLITAGSGIQAGQELMALGSGQDIEIVVPLEQSELYFIQLGSQVTIEAAGKQLAGQVSGIYPEVKDKQMVSFIAHIKLTQPPGNILSLGMSATVSIATGQEVGTIAIPHQAVLCDEKGQYFLFLAIDGKAVRQQVTVGKKFGNLREITSTMPQGSMVITSHIDQLKNGDAIIVEE